MELMVPTPAGLRESGSPPATTIADLLCHCPIPTGHGGGEGTFPTQRRESQRKLERGPRRALEAVVRPTKQERSLV